MNKTVVCALPAVAFVLSLAACERAPRDAAMHDDRAADRPAVGTSGYADTTGALRVADIVADPDRYLGQTVTLEAEVDEVLGPRAFASTRMRR